MKARHCTVKPDRYWETNEWYCELMSPIIDSEFATKQIATTEFQFNNKFNNMVEVQLPVSVMLLHL